MRENKKLLKEYGLELIEEYGFWPNKAEKTVIRNYLKTIETDFLGVGNHYAIALKHIKENLPDVKTVVDIGCAWGLQSYMFKDYDYVGIDLHIDSTTRDFCRCYPHHRFILGTFPFVSWSGDVFISSMSLGYDGSIFRGAPSQDAVEQLLVKTLDCFQYGFTVTEPWVERILEKYFIKKRLPPFLGERVSFWEHR